MHILHLINISILLTYGTSTKVGSGPHNEYVKTPWNLNNEFAGVKCLQSVRKKFIKALWLQHKLKLTVSAQKFK